MASVPCDNVCAPSNFKIGVLTPVRWFANFFGDSSLAVKISMHKGEWEQTVVDCQNPPTAPFFSWTTTNTGELPVSLPLDPSLGGSLNKFYFRVQTDRNCFMGPVRGFLIAPLDASIGNTTPVSDTGGHNIGGSNIPSNLSVVAIAGISVGSIALAVLLILCGLLMYTRIKGVKSSKKSLGEHSTTITKRSSSSSSLPGPVIVIQDRASAAPSTDTLVERAVFNNNRYKPALAPVSINTDSPSPWPEVSTPAPLEQIVIGVLSLPTEDETSPLSQAVKNSLSRRLFVPDTRYSDAKFNDRENGNDVGSGQGITEDAARQIGEAFLRKLQGISSDETVHSGILNDEGEEVDVVNT